MGKRPKVICKFFVFDMKFAMNVNSIYIRRNGPVVRVDKKYEGWNFNSGNYLFTTDTK